MSDTNVNVTFGASTSDLESGVASAREALASLASPIADLNGKYAALGAALASSHSRALQAMRSGDDAAYEDSLRAAEEAISGQISAERDGLREKLAGYADDVRNYRLTEQEKLQASSEAIQQAYAMELALLNNKRALAQDSLADRQHVDNQISALERNEQNQLTQIARQALDEQERSFIVFGDVVTNAFNTQVRGLLSGTVSWRDAFRHTLADLLISFIEFADRSVAQWIAAEVAKTAATESGTTSRTAIQQAGASASLAAQGAAVIRSILNSAAEAFAGVFGFLASFMGPLAAGPAAAIQATVAGAASTVASADIGMWSVPKDMLTLVHHNELIMPAAEAGAFRDLLFSSASRGVPDSAGVSISPTTHFHVNAIDGGSVSQWLRANSSEMLRAIDESVRHGAHLGLRRFARS